MTRRSTTTNIWEHTLFVVLKKYFQTYVIYTDFSKAFDFVSHVLRERKLYLLGFPVNLLG